MLNKQIKIERLIDHALLQLWYANVYLSGKAIENKAISNDLARSFQAAAQTIVILLYTEIGLDGPSVSYKYGLAEIMMPEQWADLFKFREEKFEHPKAT